MGKENRGWLEGWRVEVRLTDGSKVVGLLEREGRNEILLRDDDGTPMVYRKQYIVSIIGLQEVATA